MHKNRVLIKIKAGTGGDIVSFNYTENTNMFRSVFSQFSARYSHLLCETFVEVIIRLNMFWPNVNAVFYSGLFSLQ